MRELWEGELGLDQNRGSQAKATQEVFKDRRNPKIRLRNHQEVVLASWLLLSDISGVVFVLVQHQTSSSSSDLLFDLY